MLKNLQLCNVMLIFSLNSLAMKSTKVKQATLLLCRPPKLMPCHSIKSQMVVIFLKSIPHETFSSYSAEGYCEALTIGASLMLDAMVFWQYSDIAVLCISVFAWSLKFEHRRFVAPITNADCSFSILTVCHRIPGKPNTVNSPRGHRFLDTSWASAKSLSALIYDFL